MKDHKGLISTAEQLFDLDHRLAEGLPGFRAWGFGVWGFRGAGFRV